jgi:hypothetical protein
VTYLILEIRRDAACVNGGPDVRATKACRLELALRLNRVDKARLFGLGKNLCGDFLIRHPLKVEEMKRFSICSHW